MPGIVQAQQSEDVVISIMDMESKTGIMGAVIHIRETNQVASADLDGTARFSGLSAGKYTVEVKALGYKPYAGQIDINQRHPDIQIELTREDLQLNEVVVTGPSAGMRARENPVPVVRLNQVQWLQSASTNLVDAVGKLPGMSQITTGVGLSKPVIRGLAFNRVITLHDGIRQEDNQWGEEHSIHVDEYSIDQYEIIKGAGSIMYGSDGLGGVMNLLSAPLPDQNKMKAELLTNYQSNNGLVGLSAMLEGRKNSLSWRGRVTHKSAGNYQNAYDGYVFGSAFRENDISLNLGLNRKWGESRLNLSSFHQLINIVDGQRDSLGHFIKNIKQNDSTATWVTVSPEELKGRAINSASYQDLMHQKISWINKIMLSKSVLDINLAYTANHRKEYGSVFSQDKPTLYFYLQTLFYDARLTMPAVHGWIPRIGINGVKQGLQNKGEESLYPEYNLFDIGSYFFVRKKKGNWNWSAGIRYDMRFLQIEELYIDSAGRFISTPQGSMEQRFSGFKNQYGNMTVSAGASYHLGKYWQLKGNIARGFRAPSVPEIASNGVHAGTYRYEIGNKDQKSEISLQYDLGISLEKKSIYAELNFFRNAIRNYSYSEKLLNHLGHDSIRDASSPVPTFRYVQGSAVLWGSEAQVIWNPQSLRWLQFTNTFSMVLARNRSATNDSSRYLPFIPAPRYISQLKAQKERLGKRLVQCYVQLEVEHYLAQNRVLWAYGTETPTPAYTLVHAGAGASIASRKGRSIASIYFNVQNITDLAYQNHQSRLKYLDVNAITGRQGVFNMGRNFSLKVLIPLEWKMR